MISQVQLNQIKQKPGLYEQKCHLRHLPWWVNAKDGSSQELNWVSEPFLPFQRLVVSLSLSLSLFACFFPPFVFKTEICKLCVLHSCVLHKEYYDAHEYSTSLNNDQFVLRWLPSVITMLLFLTLFFFLTTGKLQQVADFVFQSWVLGPDTVHFQALHIWSIVPSSLPHVALIFDWKIDRIVFLG